jgi:hypothetical protein
MRYYVTASSPALLGARATKAIVAFCGFFAAAALPSPFNRHPIAFSGPEFKHQIISIYTSKIASHRVI